MICLKPEIQLKNVDFPHEPEHQPQIATLKVLKAFIATF